MHLKGRKGMTAMIDAMIFIVLMGLAVSTLSTFGGNDATENDASNVLDIIFSAKMRVSDLIDTDETGFIGMSDAVAFQMTTGEGRVADYIEDILSSLLQRPDSYCLRIEYYNSILMIGEMRDHISLTSVKEFTVTYGGYIKTYLMIY